MLASITLSTFRHRRKLREERVCVRNCFREHTLPLVAVTYSFAPLAQTAIINAIAPSPILAPLLQVLTH